MGKTQETLQAIMRWCVEQARGVTAVLCLICVYPPTIIPVAAVLAEWAFKPLLSAYGWIARKTPKWEALAFRWSDKVAGE